MNPKTQDAMWNDAHERVRGQTITEDRTRSVESVGKLLHALELENHKLLTAGEGLHTALSPSTIPPVTPICISPGKMPYL